MSASIIALRRPKPSITAHPISDSLLNPFMFDDSAHTNIRYSIKMLG